MSDLEEIIRKTKRRKYIQDSPCDYSVGSGTDSIGSPVVYMCQNRPVKFIPEFSMFGLYLCDEHYQYHVNKVSNGT